MAQAPSATSSDLPRVGMMATVRNRRGIISAVERASAGAEGELHLVTVDYTDTEGIPTEQLIWEREPKEPKGFWRGHKDRDPELRHTVLTQVAFRDLQ